MTTAFITGITGQDGSYLAEFLLEKGYEVHGLIRRASTRTTERIEHLLDRGLVLHHGDLSESDGLGSLMTAIRPAEIYNLAAQSHVRVSFDNPVYTVNVNALGTLRLLEVVRSMDLPVRFYQACTSEIFGGAKEVPQNERTPMRPRSPYACAKAFGYLQTVNYREAYGLFASNGILFNHESPRRGWNFVTRKITRAAARIKLGLDKGLVLGNLDAKRDWGFAGDYVEAMWLMLQAGQPDDFVIATGETHSVREFVEIAFDMLDLDWTDYVTIDPELIRPTEVDLLLGDASKARRELGWKPRTSFEDLVTMMIEGDLRSASLEAGFLDPERSMIMTPLKGVRRQLRETPRGELARPGR